MGVTVYGRGQPGRVREATAALRAAVALAEQLRAAGVGDVGDRAAGQSRVPVVLDWGRDVDAWERLPTGPGELVVLTARSAAPGVWPLLELVGSGARVVSVDGLDSAAEGSGQLRRLAGLVPVMRDWLADEGGELGLPVSPLA